jgi:hypothetical protein
MTNSSHGGNAAKAGIGAGAILVPFLLVAAACQPATPPPLTPAEEAATADTLLGLIAKQDTLDNTAQCLAAVELFTGDEPLVVSSDGGIFRSTADLTALCNGGSGDSAAADPAPDDAPRYNTVTRSAVHFLTRDHAYVVRESRFPEPVGGDSTGPWDHVVTAVFSRTTEGWRQNHYHESRIKHREPDDS